METTTDGPADKATDKKSRKTKSTKQCGGCRQEFSVQDILTRPEFRPLGLQTGPPGSGLAGVCFLHDLPDCQSSLLVTLEELCPFVVEPMPTVDQDLPVSCINKCQEFRRLDPCYTTCFFAPFQRMLVRIKAYPDLQSLSRDCDGVESVRRD